MRAVLQGFILVLVTAVLATGLSAEVALWKVGGTDRPWPDWAEEMISLDAITVSGSIQPEEADPEQNVVATLPWAAGRTEDFTVEGEPHVWHNDPHGLELRDPLVLVDGDPTTSTEDWYKGAGVNQLGRAFYLDLGVPRSVSRIRFYPRQFGKDEEGIPYKEDYLKGYELFVNDGNPENFEAERPVYQLLRSDRRNRDTIVDLRFPLQPIRFIKLRSATDKRFEIAEIEVYGEGFAAEAVYLSEVIDLGGASNFGKLGWRATKWRRAGRGQPLEPYSEASARVRVETRSGTDDTPLVYRLNAEVAAGQYETWVVDKETYFKIKAKGKMGGWHKGKKCWALPTVSDRENWDLWSRALLVPDRQIVSRAPRRWFQFRILFESDSIWEMARVDSLWFEKCTPPVADDVLAETAVAGEPRPPAERPMVAGGSLTTFTYDVRPTGLHKAFNALEITTHSPPSPQVKLEIGEPLQEVAPDSIATGPDKLTLYFPHIDKTNPLPLRVTFNTRVLAFKTIFPGKVWDTQSEDLPQFIVPGDANEDVSTNSLEVLITEKSLGKIITSVAARPEVITPNGDGVNDKAEISYTIIQLTGKARVEISIYDLAGDLVRRVYQGKQSKGQYQRPLWDGTDEGGNLVPPGIYIYEISVDTDTEIFSKAGRVVVSY